MWRNVQGMPCPRARGYLPGKWVDFKGFAGTKALLGGHSHQVHTGRQKDVALAAELSS
jgi:hypothetical protein